MNIKGVGRVNLPPVGFSVNDVVNGNDLTPNVAVPSVLVESQSNLANLPPYPAGTIAYTAGFKAMWQLNAAGSWISMI
jgi:hypothetical protein